MTESSSILEKLARISPLGIAQHEGFTFISERLPTLEEELCDSSYAVRFETRREFFFLSSVWMLRNSHEPEYEVFYSRDGSFLGGFLYSSIRNGEIIDFDHSERILEEVFDYNRFHILDMWLGELKTKEKYKKDGDSILRLSFLEKTI